MALQAKGQLRNHKVLSRELLHRMGGQGIATAGKQKRRTDRRANPNRDRIG